MSLFKNKFKYLLEQDEEEIAPPDDTAAAEALQGEVEPTSKPEDFGASVKPGEEIAAAREQSLVNQKEELKTWIAKIEEFIEYINGVNDNSIQTKLHAASCDTMFEKIASSETKRVARVAVDLSALAESLKGYLIAGDQ